MKKTTFLLLCAIFCGLHGVTTQTVTAKEVNVDDLENIPNKTKALFSSIKSIEEGIREVIKTMNENIKKINTIEVTRKKESNANAYAQKKRELIVPTKNILKKAIHITQRFISFADTHLDDLVKIFDKNISRKIEDNAKNLQRVLNDTQKMLE